MRHILLSSRKEQEEMTKGWDGVLFVYSGPYEGSIFKFRIEFPDNYPLEPPQVMFKPMQVFHPYIDFKSGKLDVQSLLNQNSVDSSQ